MLDAARGGASSPLIPLFLDLRDRKVVIFGGGAVGERKARLFSAYAPVRVFSRDFSQGLLEMAGEPGRRLELVECELSARSPEELSAYIEGAFIAIPATSDSRLNSAIREAAGRAGILVNSVDERGDVVVPSIIRRGLISIAIATEVPALTRYLRLHLDDALLDLHADMARLLSQIRSEIRELDLDQRERAAILRRILEDEQVWRLLAVSYEKAYMRARSHAGLNERDSLDAGDAQKGLH
ncbi:MAG TPA: bifunctional precorrin-2 dehydrogenase/sirohydrochlorin ferrochelatase [Methanothrix sp.]|mgnify:FL=1|nr:bifunctional precorrin-2 dehydrogenase/sirohydrochlorin ferrochelatase [Methanothrix sp.]